MPWKKEDPMDQKERFVREALKQQKDFRELCREYGISPKTGYKWKWRFLADGKSGLADHSRRPKSNSQQISEDVICEIISIKNRKRSWGSKKIRAIYKNAHPGGFVPARSTFDRLFKKTGFTKSRKNYRVLAGERLQNRIEAKAPNDLWTVDFKGWWYTPLKEKCEPLTVRDEFSKYILSVQILKKGNTECVKAHFEQLFKCYGLPRVIRSDNGPPFASAQSMFGLTGLSVWWLCLGISLDRIEPGKPTQNGSHERIHWDMKRELEGKIEGNLKHHQGAFDEWRKEFNEERPHEALGLKLPVEFYEKSKNKYQTDITYVYPPDQKKRSIDNRGHLLYKGKKIFISNAFRGCVVGVPDRGVENVPVYFAQTKIGSFSMKDFVFTPNRDFSTLKKRS